MNKSDDTISRQDAVSEIHKYFVEEIDKTPTEIDEDGDELYTDMPTVNSLLACNKELSKRIKSLPSAEPKEVYCSMASRACFANGKEVAWCLTCPHISEEDRNLVRKAVEGSQPETGKWILDPNGMDWNISAWRCSECGFVATHIGVEPNGLGGSPLNWAGSKFCPQCGVRITGYER